MRIGSITSQIVQALLYQKPTSGLLPQANGRGESKASQFKPVETNKTIHSAPTEDDPIVYDNRGILKPPGSTSVPLTHLLSQVQSEGRIQTILNPPDDWNPPDDPSEPSAPPYAPLTSEERERYALIVRLMPNFLLGRIKPDFLPQEERDFILKAKDDVDRSPSLRDAILRGHTPANYYLPFGDPDDVVFAAPISKPGGSSQTHTPRSHAHPSSSLTDVDIVA